MCCECKNSEMNRREFIGLSALGIAGASLIYPSLAIAAGKEWNRTRLIRYPERKYAFSLY